MPDVTDAGDSGLKRFVRPESSNGVKFEGTGRGFEKAAKGGQGPSNMDGRSVTVNGVEGEGGAAVAMDGRPRYRGQPLWRLLIGGGRRVAQPRGNGAIS